MNTLEIIKQKMIREKEKMTKLNSIQDQFEVVLITKTHEGLIPNMYRGIIHGNPLTSKILNIKIWGRR